MKNDSHCWACQTKLATGQIVCLKCESWQNYRRHVNLSTTTLSLVIALVSVLGVLGPAIIGLFEKEEITVSMLGLDGLGTNLEIYDESKNASVVSMPLFCGFDIKLVNEEEETGPKNETEVRYEFRASNAFNKIIVGEKINTFAVSMSGRADVNPDNYVAIKNQAQFTCAMT